MKSFIDEWVRKFAKEHDIHVFDQQTITTCSVVDTRAVLLNTDTVAEKEQAFAISHEIGHIFHEDEPLEAPASYIMENNADYFAVDLIYRHCKEINMVFEDTADFLRQTGIPDDYHNMAQAVMNDNLKVVMLLYSKKPYTSWLFNDFNNG